MNNHVIPIFPVWSWLSPVMFLVAAITCYCLVRYCFIWFHVCLWYTVPLSWMCLCVHVVFVLLYRHRQVNHARNVWDRAVTILPRANQFWYKYTYMEEMLSNVAGLSWRHSLHVHFKVYNSVLVLINRWMSWQGVPVYRFEEWKVFLQFWYMYLLFL